MSWLFHSGKIFGIDVFVHVTFLLLFGCMGVSHWLPTRKMDAALAGAGFFAARFAGVLLHEFGHALTARKIGIKKHDITLLPIGGLSRLELAEDGRARLQASGCPALPAVRQGRP